MNSNSTIWRARLTLFLPMSCQSFCKYSKIYLLSDITNWIRSIIRNFIKRCIDIIGWFSILICKAFIIIYHLRWSFNSNFYFKFTLHSIKIHQGKGFTIKPDRSTELGSPQHSLIYGYRWNLYAWHISLGRTIVDKSFVWSFPGLRPCKMSSTGPHLCSYLSEFNIKPHGGP